MKVASSDILTKKNSLNPPFSYKNVCIKSDLWQLFSIHSIGSWRIIFAFVIFFNLYFLIYIEVCCFCDNVILICCILYYYNGSNLMDKKVSSKRIDMRISFTHQYIFYIYFQEILTRKIHVKSTYMNSCWWKCTFLV